MKHFFYSILCLFFIVSKVHGQITSLPEALDILDLVEDIQIKNPQYSSCPVYNQSLDQLKEYITQDTSLTEDVAEIFIEKIAALEQTEPALVRKTLKNKRFGCLLAQNLTVCNNTTLNNLSVNGAVDINGVTSAELALLAGATSQDIPDTLVLRDGGSFAATTITLTGVLSLQGTNGNTVNLQACSSTPDYTIQLPCTAGNTGNVLAINSQIDGVNVLFWEPVTAIVTSTFILYGDVIGSSSATVVNKVCGVLACNLVNSYSQILSATSSDVPLTLVLRDSTGSFAATTITLTGCLQLYDATGALGGQVCANTNALMVAPQGTRALQASALGDNRGTNAVDLQMVIGDNSQVASGSYAVITGGMGNAGQGDYSFIGSGLGNAIDASSTYAAIISGSGNTVTTIPAATYYHGAYGFIGGGFGNTVSGYGSAIVGGGYDQMSYSGNTINGIASFIGGGLGNTIDVNSSYASIIGGQNNSIQQEQNAFIGGGQNNQVGPSSNNDIVVGGYNNIASGPYAFVGGGYQNKAYGSGSVIVGGGYAYDPDSTILIGGNTISADGTSYASFIGSGLGNNIAAKSSYSGIVTGSGNTVTSEFGFIGGGYLNTATGYSVVPGGAGNSALGNYSFAAGQNATVRSSDSGSFIWGDGSTVFTSTAANTFSVLAKNGARFITSVAPSNGVQLLPGSGAWVSASDRTKKANCQEVDTVAILEKVAALPIETWNYISQDSSIRHMGPYAQDFSAAFDLGEDPLGISTIDADGVALAAIQGMYKLYTKEMACMKQELQELKAKLKTLGA